MKLKDFIVKALANIDGTNVDRNTVHFDIAVAPFDNEVYVLRDDDQNASRISFDVKVEQPQKGQTEND